MTSMSLLRESFLSWRRDKASLLAASLAYYTIFSLPALLLVAISVASIFVDEKIVEGGLRTQLTRFIGERGTVAIQSILDSIDAAGYSTTVTIIGFAALLLGATGIMVQLQSALNTIWKVEPEPGRRIKRFLMGRLLSLALVLSLGFLLIASLILSTIATILAHFLVQYIPAAAIALPLADIFVSFLLVFILFALLFKYLPDVEIRWKDVWVGAALTAFLYIIGKTIMGIYLAYSTVLSAFGVTASIIVLLLWVYYSAQILFFGAEFTKCYSEMYGSRIRPSEGAHSTESLVHLQTAWWHRVLHLWNRFMERVRTTFRR